MHAPLPRLLLLLLFLLLLLSALAAPSSLRQDCTLSLGVQLDRGTTSHQARPDPADVLQRSASHGPPSQGAPPHASFSSSPSSSSSSRTPPVDSPPPHASDGRGNLWILDTRSAQPGLRRAEFESTKEDQGNGVKDDSEPFSNVSTSPSAASAASSFWVLEATSLSWTHGVFGSEVDGISRSRSRQRGREDEAGGQEEEGGVKGRSSSIAEGGKGWRDKDERNSANLEKEGYGGKLKENLKPHEGDEEDPGGGGGGGRGGGAWRMCVWRKGVAVVLTTAEDNTCVFLWRRDLALDFKDDSWKSLGCVRLPRPRAVSWCDDRHQRLWLLDLVAPRERTYSSSSSSSSSSDTLLPLSAPSSSPPSSDSFGSRSHSLPSAAFTQNTNVSSMPNRSRNLTLKGEKGNKNDSIEDDHKEGMRVEDGRLKDEIVKDESAEIGAEAGVLWRVTEENGWQAVGRTEGGKGGDTRRLEVLLAWMDDHERRLMLARVRDRDDEEGKGRSLSVFAFGPRGMTLVSRLGASETLTKECVWAADPTAALFCLRPNLHGLDLRAFNYRTGALEASTELPKDWRGGALLLTGAAIVSSSYVVLTPPGGGEEGDRVALPPHGSANECQEVLVRGLRTSYTCHRHQERRPNKATNVSMSSREDQRPLHIYTSEAELPQRSPPAARLLILRSATSCPPSSHPPEVRARDEVHHGDPSGTTSRSPRGAKGVPSDQERGARFLPSKELPDEGILSPSRTHRAVVRLSYVSAGGLSVKKLMDDLGSEWGRGGGRGGRVGLFELAGISSSQPLAASASAVATLPSGRRKPRGVVEERRAIALRQVLDAKRPQMPPSPPSPVPPPSRTKKADQAATPRTPKGFHHQNSTRVPLHPPYNVPALFTTAVTTAPTPKDGSGANGVASQDDAAGGDRPARPSHALNSIIFFSISLSIFATVGVIIFVRRCVRCPPAHHMTEQLEASLKPPSPPPDMFSVVPESGQGYSGATTSSSLLSSTMVASSDATTPAETPSSITALPPTPMSSHHLAPPPPPSPSSPSSLSPATLSPTHTPTDIPPTPINPPTSTPAPTPTTGLARPNWYPDHVEITPESQSPATPVANTQL